MGTTVKLREKTTPSQQIIKDATREVVVEDVQGRKITLRKPGALAQYNLVKALGDSAKNVTYLNMVMPLVYVYAIDGDVVDPFTKPMHIDALINRLEEDGITAIVAGIGAHFVEGDGDEVKK